ncbi:MAG: hypothetical protein GY703_20240 [Gammaproteobacteria bacterium]|nr:hypothetical protein [Gammaproteobacteria bacterium]
MKTGLRLTGSLWCLMLLASAAPSVWAIPSPDLVIGLSASVAQVLGLVSVLFTGLAFSNKGGGSGQLAVEKRSSRAKAWRWIFRIFVVLLFVSIAANILQHTSSVDEKNRRLQTNLVRSSIEAGKQVGDTSLKTLGLSGQIGHPLGIDNSTLAKWIEEGKPLNLIDVREPEEIQMGRVGGSWHRRYPDLRENHSNLVRNGNETVLMCYSGNRSSELCKAFSKEGKACSFVVGGYEKWIADGYPLEFTRGGSSESIRTLPDFPNRDVLLDTPEVIDLVANHNAQFVDVRYPEEFAADHLPNAVNLTIRKLPSGELIEKLTSLPSRPVIAPCYDKRSCFYGKILGSRLTDLGYEFLGRYTVPQEFFLPATGKAPETLTVLGVISAPLTAGLNWLTETTGHFSIGILLLVLFLRLVTLPLTWKSERDRLIQREMKPEIEDLKRKITDDPPRLSKATVTLYRRARLTPVRNLFASMTQLILFLVFFTVVSDGAQNWEQAFLWFPSASSVDSTYFLPTFVALLFTGYMFFTDNRKNKLLWALYVVAGAAIWFLMHQLNVAVNLYLAVNVSLLFLQSLAFQLSLKGTQKMKARAQAKANKVLEDPGVISLREAHKYSNAGHKAIRLSVMLDAGLPVPDGFVVTSKILNREEPVDSDDQVLMTKAEQSLVTKQWKRLGADLVAVRSSGLNEDGQMQSYAGVFESILNVSNYALGDALSKVGLSMRSQRSNAYSGETEEKGGALIQAMVDARYAGVLFTEHPSSSGSSMVELVSGLGESLVSGKITPESYVFGAVSGRSMDGKRAPIDLKPLLELGCQVEQLFGRAQDIEWAFIDDKFMLLQARDITASIVNLPGIESAFERERSKLLRLAPKDVKPEEVLLAQNELSELMPRPTPLSASVMERLWAIGGSTDLACRSLGIPYDVEEDAAPYVNSVFGALYVNRLEERSRLTRPPGAMAAFWLARNGENIESDFREGFLPRFVNEIRLQEALDFRRLSTNRLQILFKEWMMNFIRETYVQAEVINVATDFYWKTACTKLEQQNIDPALYLGKIPTTVVQRAMSLLSKQTQKDKAIRDFLELFGHRAPQDYELAQPRYRENPDLVIQQMARAQQSGSHSRSNGRLPRDPVLRLAVDRARRYQVLKEDAKHQCLRQWALMRKLLLVLDRRMKLDDGIFHLTLDEVLELENTPLTDETRQLISSRKLEAEAWHKVHLASELSVRDLEGLSFTEGQGVQDDGDYRSSKLVGKRVAGNGDVVGKVHVIHTPEEIDSFTEGDIVVARFTDPTWYPLFPIAGGIITEVGGWLSHAAIVAREQNLTAIVGVKGASAALKTGQLVKLRIDGTVEILPDKRSGSSTLRARQKRSDEQETSELEESEDDVLSMNKLAASGGGRD